MSRLADRVAALEAQVAELLCATVAPPHPTVQRICQAVAQEWGVTTQDIVSARRPRELLEPRQAAMGLARQLTPHSYPTIARIMRRDHSTLTNTLRNFQGRMQAGGEFAARVNRLSRALKQEMKHGQDQARG